MAYEFFDDVAFYFVLQALLAVFLIPPTIYYISKLISALKPSRSNVPQKQASAQAAWVKKVEPQKGLSRHVTWQRVLFVLGWGLFIYLWLQLPNYQGEELASFKPYEILGLEKGADEAEIKRAFRKLSKIHHPDKNPNDPDAHQKFLLIVKAHETLTDPQAKVNLEKYGNPDGYQGVSVTIGLPKWLTQKENEMKILLIYFLAMFVLPPICVYYWYKHSQQFAESGVMNASLWGFSQHIHEQMSLKYLVEVLASSIENVVLAQRPTDQKALNFLKKEVAEHMAKPKWTKENFFFIIKANILWHSYLMRVNIPAPLHQDLAHILKDAPKLLDAMLQVCVMQKYLRPTFDTITLSQMVSQGMWVEDHPLKQVPHFSDQIIKDYVKKKFDFPKFIEMEPKERVEAFPDIGFSNSQWNEVNSALAQFPNVDMKITYGVEDEEGIYENDLVLLTVTLTRKNAPEQKKKDEPKKGDTKKDKKGKKTFEDRLDDLPITPPAKKAKEGESPYVHSTRFPYPKQEKWIVILVEHVHKACDRCKTNVATIYCPPPYCGRAICPKCDQDIHKREDRKTKHKDEDDDEPGQDHKRFPIPSARIAGVQKINHFSNEPQEVQLRFRPPIAARFTYEVFARCDSYIGVDKMAVFKVEVGKERNEETKEEEDGTEDDPEDVEVKEAEAKWYYLGASSFLEMVANVVVGIVMIYFFINFLETRGLWGKFVQPTLDRLMDLWLPIWLKIYPTVKPVYDPVTSFSGQVFAYVAEKLTAPINATAPPFKSET